LWRLAGTDSRVIDASRVDLRIAEGVSVDLWEARAIAHRLLDHGSSFRETDGSRAVISLLSKDVVPEWYDDWALDEAEAWRQLRLHALEALAGHFVSRTRFGQAAVAATLAVQADPLRESARIALIGVHLAEGNRSEAVREFHRYAGLLKAELGVEPTPRMTEITKDLLSV
jgi:DNA-binding SARP family transcriptional activator